MPLQVDVLERQEEWVRVEVARGEASEGTLSGWIPAWYLVPDMTAPQKIKMVSPTLKVVTGPARVRLFPDIKAPVIAERESGRVVRLRRTWGGWGFVEITAFSVPAAGAGWMALADLKPLGEGEPREGVIKEGQPYWPGWQFEATKEPPLPLAMGGRQMVFVEIERDGLVLVGADGGWSAWVKKGDIIPDPWWGRSPESVTSENDCTPYALPEGARVYMVATAPAENTISLSYSTEGGLTGVLALPFDADPATCKDPQVGGAVATAREEHMAGSKAGVP